jgi:hypothetical protein
MGKWAYALLAPVAISIVTSCSSSLGRVTDPVTLNDFSFLQAGITSRTEIETRLGGPNHVYEEGRITTYRLEKIAGQYKASSTREARYQLVLAYRPDGVLERWSLIHTGL